MKTAKQANAELTGEISYQTFDYGAHKERVAKRDYEKGRKAGIKEVVDWINTHIADAFPYANEEWQAKLKSWNISA